MPIKDVKSPSVSAEPVIFGETFNASLRVCHQKKHVLLVCSLIIQLPVFFFFTYNFTFQKRCTSDIILPVMCVVCIRTTSNL